MTPRIHCTTYRILGFMLNMQAKGYRIDWTTSPARPHKET